MSAWQQELLVAYVLINLVVFIRGYHECKYKKNAYGLTHKLSLLGIFAWGDAVVFAPFWIAAVVVSLILSSWFLFGLIVSVFWVVRSLGETIYWFNQQFSAKAYDWNKPENLMLHWLLHNDSIWFVYQISWQCVTVISVIFALYFAKLWLGSF